jgi:large subunit ribosomal protein L10
MDRAEKRAEVESLNNHFNRSQIAICADYRGLSVAEITEFRKSLVKNNSFGKVVKNTLARLAVDQAFADADAKEIEKFKKLLEGPSMMVFSYADPVSPSKAVSDFAKTHDKLKVKGGWIDGTCVDEAGVKTLSTMPSREETLGKLLALINAPATQLLRLMQAPGTQVVRVLDAHKENLEKAGK